MEPGWRAPLCRSPLGWGDTHAREGRVAMADVHTNHRACAVAGRVSGVVSCVRCGTVHSVLGPCVLSAHATPHRTGSAISSTGILVAWSGGRALASL